LGAKDVSCTAGGHPALKPAVTPVHEPEAIDFVVGSRSLYQALAPAAFATPDAGAGGMERKLDLILERELRTGQQVEQVVEVGRHFSEQVRLDKRSDGWRGRCASPGQDHLHPQAFPT
jgi:hypothetical protein